MTMAYYIFIHLFIYIFIFALINGYGMSGCIYEMLVCLYTWRHKSRSFLNSKWHDNDKREKPIHLDVSEAGKLGVIKLSSLV